MKKFAYHFLPVIALCALVITAVAAGIIQSGWTTTDDPATARAALGINGGDIDLSSITSTNGITNLINIANTVLRSDVNKAITSIPNAAGALTNTGAGVVGWYLGFASLDANNMFSGANLFTGQNTFNNHNTFAGDIQISANETVTGCITNSSLSASSLIKTDSNKRLQSVVNASGFMTNDGSGVLGFYPSANVGSVTSVAMTVPSILSVSGSPITGSGTLGITLQTEIANMFFAGPATLGPSVPTFRLIANRDLGSTTAAFYDTQNAWTVPQGLPGITITNSETNLSVTASTVLKVDGNKVVASIANAFGVLTNDGAGNVGFTADGNSLTNLHYAYSTNAIPNTGTLSFGGKSYVTNIQASITLPAFATVDPTLYETLVLRVTNSTASDLTVTMPSGVLGTPGAGLPAIFYCTNKVTTYIYVSHYGRDATNAWKQDFAQ